MPGEIAFQRKSRLESAMPQQMVGSESIGSFAGFQNLIDFYRGVIRAGIDALHAVVADLVGIEIASLTLAAVVAELSVDQQAHLFHGRLSPFETVLLYVIWRKNATQK